jgi:Family of unknown function (DUF6491)
MKSVAAALFLVLIPIAAEAQTKPTAQICLRQNMVWGWNVVDDKTLIVTDRARKAYRVSLMPGCFNLKFQMRLSLRSYSGMGLSCLTRNDYVLVPPNAGMPGQRCLISDIALYAPPIPPR